MTEKFAFSIIIAVYNCEPFLQETLDSLLKQTFDFSKVEVILVDDGSTDTSAEICDAFKLRYPENTVVIHKANGGVSSARNAGVQIACGEYLNFLDSDDKLSNTVLSDIYDFFITHKDEVDIATIPMRFFGAKRGEHWLNGKFEAGTRVIELEKEPYNCVMSVSASFYASKLKPLLYFNEKQKLAEDAVVNARILCNNPNLGVVNTCSYEYRRRIGGEASAIQSSTQMKWCYVDYMNYFVVEAIDYAKRIRGCIPEYIQFVLACDLHWRIRDIRPLDGVLKSEEQQEFIELLHWAFSQIDDQVLLAVPTLSSMLQFELMYFKHQQAELLLVDRDVYVKINGRLVGCLSNEYVKLETLTLRKGILEIDGTIWRYGCEQRDTAVWLNVNALGENQKIPCTLYDRPDLEKRAYGTFLCYATGFRAKIDLSQFSGEYTISVYQRSIENAVIRKKIQYAGFYSALGTTWNSQYISDSNRILKISDGQIVVSSAKYGKHILCELQFLRDLLRSKKRSNQKAVIARLLYWAGKIFKRRKIWLITDKLSNAGDNGEAFFRYMCEKKPVGIDFYFVIDKRTNAFKKLSKIGKVLSPNSYYYKILYLMSDCVISSQADKESTNPFHDYWHPYQDLMTHAYTVFLQHGVIKSDLSNWLRHHRQDLAGFVTSTKAEYDSIINGSYGYTEKEVWLTGLPRFDRLYCAEQKRITIMPTWRRYLVDVDREKGSWKANSLFENSDYLNFYRALLNDQMLLAMADKYGYQIHFKPHPNISKYACEFIDDSRVILDDDNTSYQDVYAASDLIVTDYSSAIMDFAYLRKPIIYCHFDADEFFSGKHTSIRGYYDDERDGFGEVEYDLEGAIDRVIEYIKNNCILKEKYNERISHFFAYNDRNNCQRVFEKILDLR